MQLLKRFETVVIKHPTSKKELIAQNPTVFEGLCQFPGEHHKHVDPKAILVIHGCRKIPLAVLGKLKDTLDQLLQADVITPVTQPTPWVNSLVITEKKNGSLRVCLDPRDLNKAALRQHFSIPTIEDVLCKLAGKKKMSPSSMKWMAIGKSNLTQTPPCYAHSTHHVVDTDSNVCQLVSSLLVKFSSSTIMKCSVT